MGGCELDVLGQLADRDAFGLLPVGGADHHRELRAGQRHRAAERLATGNQAAERQHHQVERLPERLVAAAGQQFRVRHRARHVERRGRGPDMAADGVFDDALFDDPRFDVSTIGPFVLAIRTPSTI